MNPQALKQPCRHWVRILCSFVGAALLSAFPLENAGAEEVPITVSEFSDGTAQIYELTGNVQIMKNGTDQWLSAEKGMLLEPGDQILTRAQSALTIAFDSHFLNFTHIGEETKAQIRSLEPSDIFLEDGRIFCALDGLPPGQTYQTTTPTAVAAVRGTHFWSAYDPASTNAVFSVVPYDDNRKSFLELMEVGPNGEPGNRVLVPEGFEWKSKAGGDSETPAAALHKIEPEESSRQAAIFRDIALKVPGFDQLRESGRQKMVEELNQAGSLNLQPTPEEPPLAPEKPEKEKKITKKQIMKGIAAGVLSEYGLDAFTGLGGDGEDDY